MAYKFQGASTSGAANWFLQRLTGLVLVVLLLVHFYIAHRTWDSGHNWDTIIQRLSSPYMKMFYLAFVLLGLWHGLNGLWSVLRDYNLKPGTRTTLFSIIVVVGVFIGVLGFITMLTLPAPH
jgi:succinate dehydrogenase / fumarate reductase, membrane anchor subunit